MKNLTFCIAALLFLQTTIAQVPQAFNYQAVARDKQGNVMKNQNITLRLSIHSTSAVNPAVYTEEKTVSTNQFGLFTIAVGENNTLFKNIDWSQAQAKFLEVEINTEGSYMSMGSTQLLSVPYALYADKSKEADALNPNSKITPSQIDGSGLNANSILVWDGSKWIATDLTSLQTKTAGIDWSTVGNAVTGADFIGTTNAVDFVVKTNSIEQMRITHSNTILPGATNTQDFGSAAKGWKDVYATGTYKLDGNTMLDNKGSRNIFVGNSTNTTLSTGNGNVVVGDSAGAKLTTAYGVVFLGQGTGLNTTTGQNNIFIGNNVGKNNTTGFDNIFIGLKAGNANTTASGNTAIGSGAGQSNTSGPQNLFIGANAGQKNTTGGSITALGFSAGQNNTTATGLTAVGTAAGQNNTTGFNNTYVGRAAGQKSKTASNNTGVGHNALLSDSTGNANTAIGDSAMMFTGTGRRNVGIGTRSGFTNTSGNENTFVGYGANANSASLTNATAIGANAVVDQDNAVVIGNNANVGIGTSTPTYKLDLVHGGATGLHVQSSSLFSVVDIDAANGDAALRFVKAGVNQWNVRNNPSTDDLQFFELGGGGERMRIENSTGNVVIAQNLGVGTTASLSNKLTVLNAATSGEAGNFSISNSSSTSNVGSFTHSGIGSGIQVQLTNASNGGRGVDVLQAGVGPGVFSTSAGGNAVWGITSSISAAGVIGDNTFGEAVVGRNRGGNGVGAVVGRNDSSGYGCRGFNTKTGIGVLGQAGISGGTGVGGRFENVNSANSNNALQATTNGTGYTANFTSTNNSTSFGLNITTANAASGDALNINNGSNTLLLVKNTGQVGIGTGSPTSVFRAQIIENTKNSLLLGAATGAAEAYFGVNRPSTAPSSGFNDLMRLRDNGSSIVSAGIASDPYQFQVNGNALASGGVWTNSDQRIKTDIKSLEGALAQVLKLKPTSYYFDNKNEEYKYLNLPDELQFGFLAQDLKTVFPNIVREDVKGNEDGTPRAHTVHAVNYMELIPVLTKAIQEQQAEIEQLKKEIETLKNH